MARVTKEPTVEALAVPPGEVFVDSFALGMVGVALAQAHAVSGALFRNVQVGADAAGRGALRFDVPAIGQRYRLTITQLPPEEDPF